MYRSILLLLDGSMDAKAAVPIGLAIARASGAALHVARRGRPMGAMHSGAGAVTGADERAGHATSSFGDGGVLVQVDREIAPASVPVEPVAPSARHIHDATDARHLVDHAADVKADLIVLPPESFGHPARRSGSPAVTLARRCGRPCLVVRPSKGGVIEDREPLFRHVLIPLDGSVTSEAVLPHAFELGLLGGALYTLLHVLPPSTLSGYPAPGSPAGRTWWEYQERFSNAQLDRPAAWLRQRSPVVRTATIRGAHTARAICGYAIANAVDLIALTTYGGALSRMLLGNVAARVTRRTETSVLLFRPPLA